MRVAVYAIARDELRHVERFLASCEGAEAIVVSDTGSKDGTPEALRQGGAQVHAISITPWRFDDARNASLAVVPADIDLCIALDLDEVLNPGWRAALEAEWKPESNRGRYLYAWSHKPDGSPSVEFWSDKIHSRRGWRWRHICHEALYPDRLKSKQQNLRGLRVDHWPDNHKKRGYLPLLEAAAAEDPRDSRSAYYLGREYYLHNRMAEAETTFRRYLSLPGATWNSQNSAAMRYIGLGRAKQDDLPGALDWLGSATRMDPKNLDAWVSLAEMQGRAGHWVECLRTVDHALTMDMAPRATANDPKAGEPVLRKLQAEAIRQMAALTD